MSAYTGTFSGYPINFINDDFSFFSESSHFVSPSNALSKAIYLRFYFFLDKGGTENIQERTFSRLPVERSSFFPLLTALHTLERWTSCDLDILTPILCYWNTKVVNFIHYSVVTKNLREATLHTYPIPHNFYKLHLKDVLRNSV